MDLSTPPRTFLWFCMDFHEYHVAGPPRDHLGGSLTLPEGWGWGRTCPARDTLCCVFTLSREVQRHEILESGEMQPPPTPTRTSHRKAERRGACGWQGAAALQSQGPFVSGMASTSGLLLCQHRCGVWKGWSRHGPCMQCNQIHLNNRQKQTA